MRRVPLLLLIAAVTTATTVGLAGDRLLRNHRTKRYSTEDSMQSLPLRAPEDAPDCSPLFPGIPDVLSPDVFDPADFDELSVAGAGRVVAYATALQDGALPAPRREIVLVPEGKRRVRITPAAGHHDDPDVQFDRFGRRVAFSGWADAASETIQNVYLHSTTRAGAENTRNVTNLSVGAGTAFDPALAARGRSREIGGGIEVDERDARLVFVSTADLDKGGRPVTDAGPGRNPDGLPQLFVWFERRNRFHQITRVTESGATLNRPCISKNGRIVYFESSADLTPDAVNPNDFSRVGNPARVRQIYRWKAKKGISQLTWSDRDCFAPRCNDRGNVVYFCSSGDLITGGNPERNFEVFRWRSRGRKTRRLRQVTAAVEGDSVLPRPTRNGRKFTFLSTASPPTVFDEFGSLNRECLPKAYYWNRGNVTLLFGAFDAEVAQLLFNDPNAVPPLTGPPVPGDSLEKIHFASSDSLFNPLGEDGQSSAFAWHVIRATRFAPRKRR